MPEDKPSKPPIPLDYATPSRLPQRVNSAFNAFTGFLLLGGGSLLFAILVLVMLAPRGRANSVKCAANLKWIGTGLLSYNNCYKGYPVFGNNPTPGRTEIAGTFFMLVKYSDLATSIFCCPATDASADPANFQTATNFARPDQRSLSYALTNPAYRPSQGGFRWLASQSADWAIAADGNYPYSSTNPNSANHGGDGQNVLYNDGHVDWSTNLMAGKLTTGKPDDITTCNGADPMDTQILPLSWGPSNGPQSGLNAITKYSIVVGTILLLGLVGVPGWLALRRRLRQPAA
jgi:hypothetical protein